MNDKICCKEIITAKSDINNIGEKVNALESLYKPVSRLTVLFIISIFILTGCLSLTVYTVQSLVKNEVALAKIEKDTGYLRKDIKELKSQVAYTQNMLRGEDANRER